MLAKGTALVFLICFTSLAQAQTKLAWLDPFQMAIRGNPQVEQSQNYTQSFAKVSEYYYLLPSLALNGKKVAEKSSRHSLDETSYFLESEWNLYRGGADYNNSELQNIELNILKNEVENFRLATALNLAEQLAQLNREKALLQITLEKIKTGEELLIVAQRQAKSGVSLEMNSNLLRLKLNEELVKKIEVENSIINIENQIRFLTGKDVPNIQLPQLGDLVSLVTEVEINPQSAAIRSSELNLKKAHHEKSIAQSELMPRVDLAAMVGQLEDTPASTQSNRIEAKFTWTIFDSSVRSIELRQASLNEQIAKLKSDTIKQTTAINNRKLGLRLGTIQRRQKQSEQMADTLNKNATLAVRLALRGALAPLEAWEAIEAQSTNRLEKHNLALEITQTIKMLLIGGESRE